MYSRLHAEIMPRRPSSAHQRPATLADSPAALGPEEIRAYQQVYLTDTKRSVDQSVSAEHLAASLREAVRAQDLVMSH